MNFDSLTCKVLKKVACGIIIHNNKILVSQRSPAKTDYPMFWEFTGGRFENNETVKQCIEREIKEELNIDSSFVKVIHEKKHNSYYLYYCLCFCDDIANIQINHEVNDYKLVSYDELCGMDLIPGDLKIITDVSHIIKKFTN